MNDAITYLYNRITEGAEVKAQSPRANISAGVAVILELYDTQFPTKDDVEIFLNIAHRSMQKRIKYNTPGEMRLTAASSAIGRDIRKALGDMPKGDDFEDWKRDISVGDLLIESLNYCDYLSVNYDQAQKCYMVNLERRWQFLKPRRIIEGGLSPDPIDPITGLYQSNGKPVIKRWKPQDAALFQEYINAPFVRAVDKAQQQGWKINLPVYKAILRERQKQCRIDTSGDQLKYQQSVSRASEYRMVVGAVHVVRKWTQFYCYFDCDYRGRLYFDNPYFNFQKSDWSRGIMLFDKPKRVTERGLKWLARHTACSFNKSYHKSDQYVSAYRSHLDTEGLDDISVDKMTLDDRAKWTWDNMQFILETAENLTLHDCEKPVSFLACCLEWKKYHDLENKELFYSALPIPIDGSNNGWQHLAAISQDASAGKLVGLVPVEVQEDFYVKTAKALIARQPEWFEERNMPMKKIRKGISKRGSMTRAYSAGATKICENMYLDCRTMGFDEEYNISQKDCFMLARNLVQAIDVVCPGPLQTMKFLQLLVTDDISKTGDHTIFWESPSGFPVVYTAPRVDKKRYRIRMRTPGGGDNRINHVGQFPTEYPDIKKFMSGISPNFIHSLDAAHMCNVMDRWDGSFGGVHDSFSTHADDVDDLLELTKEVFIEQYTPQDGNNFNGIKRMLGLEETEVANPGLGNLNIGDIRKSDYFFA